MPSNNMIDNIIKNILNSNDDEESGSDCEERVDDLSDALRNNSISNNRTRANQITLGEKIVIQLSLFYL
jgi:transcription elongation GreA/GreB family factor